MFANKKKIFKLNNNFQILIINDCIDDIEKRKREKKKKNQKKDSYL